MNHKTVVTRIVKWACLVLLLTLFAVDFHFDIRYRDAFSWMDPDQYYQFATRTAGGEWNLKDLFLPSIFPLFLYPVMVIKNSIPAALWANFFFIALLALAVRRLCRQTGIRAPAFLVVATIIASPLILGLSRELYVEISLTALIALNYILLFRTDHFTRRPASFAFAAMLGFGFMTKMTYPLFFIGPFAVETVRNLVNKRYRRFGELLIIFTAPLMIALALQTLILPYSVTYYRTLGNTVYPIMRLLGPPEVLSMDSLFFYYAHIWKTQLFILTPFLLLPVFYLKNLRRWLTRQAVSRDLVLWSWFLVPLTLLIFQPVKEPRHVAPCVVPAVLLIFRGIQQVSSLRFRKGLLITILLLSTGQYLAITSHTVYCPYFFDQPLPIKAIEEALFDTVNPDILLPDASFETIVKGWKFPLNLVIAGFDPNAALGIAYYLFPSVIYNLDGFPPETVGRSDIPYEKFRDLNMLTTFNIYNSRCRGTSYYRTLNRETVLKNADYIMVKFPPGTGKKTVFSGFDTVAEILCRNGTVVVLAANRNTQPYRSLYIENYLDKKENIDSKELNTIHFELFMTSLLKGPAVDWTQLSNRFPKGFIPGKQRHWIYWDAAYHDLHRQVLTRYNRNFGGNL
jgi:hypothetical protein